MATDTIAPAVTTGEGATEETVQQKKNHLHYNLSKYGIDIPTYEAMATAQDHECAICRTPEAQTGERLLLDHCHATGKVRGLLCRNCNTGLGRFKDSPAILQNAHAYIANALWDVGHDLTDIKQYLPRS